VLRAELKPGATVLVEPGEEGEEDVKLSILQPVPAGVGASGEPADEPEAPKAEETPPDEPAPSGE